MNQMNIEQARFNMIEQQIRPWDVLDQRVLDVLSTTPRETFVPEKYQALAFTDTHIPLGCGQVMMDPKLEGRLLQSLNISSTDTVLEVGTGSGYLTACLSKLGSHVTSIDLIPEFTEAAQAKLDEHAYTNTSLQSGNAFSVIRPDAIFDVIALTGSVPELNEHFFRNLAIGGRLFAITGNQPIMEAVLVTRINEKNWAQESLFETSLPALTQASELQDFQF